MTNARSMANRMVDRMAVMMVSTSEKMEKACDARKREVMKETAAKPAAIGCRTRTPRRTC